MKKNLWIWLSLLLTFAFLLALPIHYSRPSGVQIHTASVPQDQIMTGNDAGTHISSELLPGELININTSSAEELKRLPGIGDALSSAIVSYREEHGDFACIEDIMLVNGIGQVRFEAIRAYITVAD